MCVQKMQDEERRRNAKARALTQMGRDRQKRRFHQLGRVHFSVYSLEGGYGPSLQIQGLEMPSAFARMPSATDLASASRQRTLDCVGLKLEIKLALWEVTQCQQNGKDRAP